MENKSENYFKQYLKNVTNDQLVQFYNDVEWTPFPVLVIKEYQQRFMVYSGEKIRAVKSNEIACFQIIEKDVFLCTFDNRNYSLDYSLDKIEKMVDPDIFFRINRKQIINIEAVETMYQLSGSRIKIILNPPSEEETVVSFHRVSAFKKWLNR